MIDTVSSYFKSAYRWLDKHPKVALAAGMIALGYLYRDTISNVWGSFSNDDRTLVKLTVASAVVGNVILGTLTKNIVDAGSRIDIHSDRIDLTKKAREGKLPAMFGREDAIEALEDTLLRHDKPNAILVGPAGVGKTAVVEGLAQRVAEGKVADSLKKCRIITITASDFNEDTHLYGMLEKRVKLFLQDVAEEPNLIIFIDEIHTLMESGGAMRPNNLQNMLKAVLARKGIRVIGCTTEEEYTRFMQDEAFNRRFSRVDIKVPNSEELTKMIQVRVPQYEKTHGCIYSAESIAAAIELTKGCGGIYPDKVLTLLDTAGARLCRTVADPKHRTVTRELLESLLPKKHKVLTVANNVFVFPFVSPAFVFQNMLRKQQQPLPLVGYYD